MDAITVKGAVSFGFKKKIESKVDESKVIKETSKEDNELLDEVSQDSLSTKIVKKELIIPLIQKNRWKNIQTPTDSVTDLEAEAAQELIKESAQYMDEAASNTDVNNEFENLAVPLLLKNKVPDGFENDDKLNVDLRPDEASLKDYDDIPIEAFGMAMLRGMGWDPNVGIGRTFKQNVKMLETTVRPKGLGLGATALHNPGKSSNKNGSESEILEISKNSFVSVMSGSHRRKYGIIEGLDSDNAQCVVKLALGGKTATIGIHALKPVSKSEYMKYGKDLSRLTKAHAIEQERKLVESKNRHMDPDQSPDEMSQSLSKHKKRKKMDAEYRKSPDEHRRHRKERYTDKDLIQNKHKSKKRTKGDDSPPLHHRHAKKKKSSYKDRDSDHAEKSHKVKKSWLQPNLRVRMIDERFRKGKHYNEKLIVVDVLDRNGHCCCKTDGGKLLDDIHEDMLETVVPRSNSDAYVVITSRGKSKHDGKLAKILEKHKETCEAYLQLIEDRDIVVRVNFDDICEYSGDIEAYHMF